MALSSTEIPRKASSTTATSQMRWMGKMPILTPPISDQSQLSPRPNQIESGSKRWPAKRPKAMGHAISSDRSRHCPCFFHSFWGSRDYELVVCIHSFLVTLATKVNCSVHALFHTFFVLISRPETNVCTLYIAFNGKFVPVTWSGKCWVICRRVRSEFSGNVSTRAPTRAHSYGIPYLKYSVEYRMYIRARGSSGETVKAKATSR